MRPFFWKHKKRINIYADARTLKALKKKYDFCFYGGQGYIPIMKPNLIKKKQMIKKGKNKISFDTFKVEHGQITSTAYVFNKTAYLSDCSNINPSDLNKLKKLNYLIIDCLWFERHLGHFNSLFRPFNFDNEVEKKKKDQERSSNRRNQIGTGDRSERIRTYNFPQGRVTDHRINLTLHKLDEFLSGEIHEEMNQQLRLKEQSLKLENLN